MPRPVMPVLVLASLLVAGCGADPIEGAWKVVNLSYAGPDTSWTLPSPQPSLYLFAQRYYSVMFVPGSLPRAQWGSVIGTDSEKLAAFDSFMAHSGSYETKAGTVAVSPIMSKVPNTMVPGVSQTYAYVVRGDSLTLTLKQNRAETRTTLTRLR